MDNQLTDDQLFDQLRKKAIVKQVVYDNTYNCFKQFKQIIRGMNQKFHAEMSSERERITFEYRDKGEFQIELQFAGDVLVFLMHTNVFEIPRDHDLMRSSYIREDKDRSYCGVIHVYNFLADSFKYNRENDLGYLIGRIFINKDLHYFIEGKRELGQLYHNFPTSILTPETSTDFIRSAILYTINFDLLIPPFDEMKIANVAMIQSAINNMKMATGKRLGFRFLADNE
jgi:hypothetical protein